MVTFDTNLKSLKGRLDPRFYQPDFVETIDKLQNINSKPLGDLVEFSSEYWDQEDLFVEEFPYLEISGIDINTGEIKEVEYKQKNKAPSRAKMIVKNGDILISTTRPHRGAISLVNDINEIFIASTGFTIIRNLTTDEISKEYLYYALRMNTSLSQLHQRSSGGNYPAITREQLERILIPIPSNDKQEQIIEIMSRAVSEYKSLQFSFKETLNSINKFVLDNLSITVDKPRNTSSYSVFISDLDDRLDPYYYQPFFTGFIEELNNLNYQCVKFDSLISNIINGYSYRKYLETGTPYLKVSNINPFRIDKSEVDYIDITIEDINKPIEIKKDNILLTRKGTYGISVPIDSDLDDVISSEIMKIELVENANPWYISSVLNSSIGQIQFDRVKIGAIMGSISQNAVKSLLIPYPSLSKQNDIAKHVKSLLVEAEHKKTKSAHVINDAKKTVDTILFN